MDNWYLEREPSYRYQLLSRLKMDCDYYLGNGGRNPDCLWAGNEKEQIAVMLDLWHSFPEEDTPEWLTLDDLAKYHRALNYHE